jgi:hypothetical protein
MFGQGRGMPIESIRGVVEAAIQRASNATGVDFGFLLGTAHRESRFDPGARAPTSSAAGLFQFTEQTWLASLRRYGARYGYGRYTEMIAQGANGRYYVTGGPEARRAVMDLRFDAHASSLMAGELTSANAAYLRGRIGREPTAGELYAAHFLGSQGAARLVELVRTTPNAPANASFPDAAAANRPIFYRQGRAATVAEVYANLSSGPAAERPAAAPRRSPEAPQARQPQQDLGFTQYAGARQAERIQAQRAVVDLLLRGPETMDDVTGSRLSRSMFTAEMLQVLSADRAQRR